MKNFPEYYKKLSISIRSLSGKIPNTMEGFSKLHKNSTAKGVLSTKVKELVALSIAIAVRCDGCIAFHVHDALDAGASRDEILEIIGVAIMMGGGPALVYGCEAYEALQQFEDKMSKID